jgi:hypothetical protein
MTRQGTGNREQGTEGRDRGPGIRDQQAERLSALVRNAVLPVDKDAEPKRDLWPAIEARLNQREDVVTRLGSVPWFDWVLAGGVALLAVAFPAAVPVLLYYL